MKLLLEKQSQKLLANHLANKGIEDTTDFKPVVKFFNPVGAATWLLTEMDEYGTMFGLCDLGMGSPELGSVTFDEIQSIDLPYGLGIERDINFKADKKISQYADQAREIGRIEA